MITWQIQIKGVVQGVGFRPFVHRWAESLGLEGEVCNDSNGVTINFSAERTQAKVFYQRLISEAPALSVITSHSLMKCAPKSYSGFAISRSEEVQLSDFRITPDLGMCDSCRDEINDPNNRRFGYAFTTCTNCGPRYSILTDLPFDRENTSMARFKMCEDCRLEYEEPASSRHHSQTNSCANCGIMLKLFDSKLKKYVNNLSEKEIVKLVADQILQGSIVAIKGIGGFLLISDATNGPVVKELRQRKHRPNKPLALIYPSFEMVERDYQVSGQEKAALLSPAAPIVLLSPQDNPIYKIAYDQINPGLDRVGVMLPYAPLFELIAQKTKLAMVATSGNMSGSPIIHDNDTAVKTLSQVADYISTHNRDITFPQDDSVVQFTQHNQQKIIIRRARGLSPNYINPKLKIGQSTRISFGADLKSAFGLAYQGNISISQYLGDMSNYEVQENGTACIRRFKSLLNKPVNKVLVDKHPNYHSCRLGIELAAEQVTSKLEVQHHLAHFCALLGEHNLVDTKDKILGVIWDGTGFGDDGHIWGSEYFTSQHQQFVRVSHLKYFNAIAGDKLSQEPRLAALAIGFDHKDVREPLKHKFTSEEWRIYNKQLKSGVELQSSSMGRLFDAVASILGITDINTYEAEAAMNLQTLAGDYVNNYSLQTIKPYDVLYEQLE
ncbi:MAG: carbamoyltransferase HypF, partial [Cyclobacteriaceae bacterium]